MEEDKLELQKKNLIERLGVLLEKKHQLAPLAARIVSTLVMNGQIGVTFEELVNGLCASKSTISNHLENLQATRMIRYFTKPGDRKRYFVINPDLTLEMIDETVAAWKNEQELQEEILQYKKLRNKIRKEKQEPLFNLEFHENLLVFLEESTAAITKLKAQIIRKSDKNELT